MSPSTGASSTAGLSLSDWIGLAEVIVAILAIAFGLIGAHFHSAVRKDDARTKIIQRLTSTRRRDVYHDYLRTALDWLDEKIGPPPLARGDLHSQRVVGIKSFLVCIGLSLVYSIGSYLAGWVIGGPGALARVILIEFPGAPQWMPEWLPRLILALVAAGIALAIGAALRATALTRARVGARVGARALVAGAFVVLVAVAVAVRVALVLNVAGGIVAGAVVLLAGVVLVAGTRAGVGSYIVGVIVLATAIAGAEAVAINKARAFITVAVAMLIVAGAGAVAAAVTGAIAVVLGIAGAEAIVLAVAEAGVIEPALILLLFLLALPYLNGLLDWLSLSVSRWFGRAILAEASSPGLPAITVGLALADLVAAVAFAFAVAWLIAFGVEASGLAFGLSLDLEAYVRQSSEAPWTTGIWATFMVLSTLVPTAIHFILALGAVLMAWSGNPLNRLAGAGSQVATRPITCFPSST